MGAIPPDWSPADGWRSYEAWKRWYRREWGGLQEPVPPGSWRAAYRAFSLPEGIQAEVEIATGPEPPDAVDEAEVRRWARASLLRFRDLIARDPREHDRPAVVVQVVVGPGGGPTMGCGEVGAPPTAPRRPLSELVALALEELGPAPE